MSPLDHPVFLVGAERSGTTLLRLMLDHHPRIAFLFEFEYAVRWMGEDGSFPEIETFRQRLAEDRIFLSTGFSVDPALGYRELVEDFLRQKQARDAKPIVGATVHHHFDRLLRLWPRARFIHLIRDPRDVARSCVGMGWAGNVWTGVERWLTAERLWDTLRERLEPADRHEIRYEDLVHQPQVELASICAFLGLEPDPAMLRYPETSSYRPPSAKNASAWRSKLSEREIRLVEARAGSMLVQRGYEPSGLPPLELSAPGRVSLRMHDAVARRRARLKRYGPWLVLSHFLSHRLGLRSWQARLRPRFHRIDESYLQ